MAHDTHRPLSHAPGLTRVIDPIFRRLLVLGVPMGTNVLVTIRGRVSGTPREQPLAIVAADGRRWVMGVRRRQLVSQPARESGCDGSARPTPRAASGR